MLTTGQVALFKKWSAEKRLISIIVRTKTSFFLELEDFHKPRDVALVAFVSKKTLITDGALACFDLILFFDPSRNTYANVHNFDEVRIPDLEQLGNELKEVVDLGKLQLIYGNESAAAPVCNLRQLLGLKGPYLSDISHIRNKNLVKEIALKNGIPTAKSVTLDFANLDLEIPTLLSKIEQTLGGYPIFKRPTSLAGCQGAEKIPSRRSLKQWLSRALRDGDKQIFCVQGFQKTPKSDDYLLVELAHRPAGSRTNSVCYKSCGISQETALLMSHIDPTYRPRADPYWKRPTELALWFPQRKGVFAEYTPLPEKENVKSEMETKWLKPLGTILEQPKDINKHLLILTLRCEDRHQLLKDAKWISDNWRPSLKAN
ncbi:hypothetical protein QR680_004730 [Steinernema hermaphroditum]|uniref:ATP-grasp domain-containing protein n=1 Tax=Steinernema hermaphroditum TaxID=289476 RepID=A0AA39HPM5_9BILA|nr:hypothetical protein QR680_004730 [Steinernema hermaphroditum]